VVLRPLDATTAFAAADPKGVDPMGCDVGASDLTGGLGPVLLIW